MPSQRQSWSRITSATCWPEEGVSAACGRSIHEWRFRTAASLAKRTEPIAKALAGRRAFPLWAVLHHRGRKSGTDYATPVAVVPTTDPNLVLIGLPWGPKTNWARNVVAAGSADLTWKGALRSTTSPRIIEPTEAAALAKRLFRPVVQRMLAAIVLRRSHAELSPRQAHQGSSAIQSVEATDWSTWAT